MEVSENGCSALGIENLLVVHIRLWPTYLFVVVVAVAATLTICASLLLRAREPAPAPEPEPEAAPTGQNALKLSHLSCRFKLPPRLVTAALHKLCVILSICCILLGGN